ncbi:zona pellucida sperm-binding protein 3-like [Cynoglossus semilaevis]|uniref:Zona pellucida sperm-binding protein 3 n=1 Tax=Cynoglossus semilaevis TaxID=244447 RepID=A0A3P8WDC3_CYNSE|nr:zona pellucida sperm-binding protein 3-like [Cynoglossus semilaevis]XP_008332190.1 zona pellucida sperm-binding protein 3-like [Cynoglossus semilaevis]
MEVRPQRIFSWWIIFIIYLHALAEVRLVKSQNSRSENGRKPTRTQNYIRFQESTVSKQLQSAELSTRLRPITVKCHPDSLEVVVQADLFETGIQIDGQHLRLGLGLGLGLDPVSGSSSCTAVPSGEAEFTIRARLTDCGTKLSSTKEKIIYSTVLIYSPESSSNHLQRLDAATIPVECHYDRKYSVDSFSLQPTWVPLVSMTTAENRLYFTLKLMTDDWQFERTPPFYFLGDTVNFEVSAIVDHYAPLRVFVDRCTATSAADTKDNAKYDFIEHGCLTDAYLTNSNSHFKPRVKQHKLRFQMDAFKFHQQPTREIYINCYVKAVPASTINSQNRACSYLEKRWWSVDGNDQACRSCDVSYQSKEPKPTHNPMSVVSTTAWSAVVTGQTLIKTGPDPPSVSYIRFRPGMQQSQNSIRHQSSGGVMKRSADDTTVKTERLGPLTALTSSKVEPRTVGSRSVLQLKKTS